MKDNKYRLEENVLSACNKKILYPGFTPESALWFHISHSFYTQACTFKAGRLKQAFVAAKAKDEFDKFNQWLLDCFNSGSLDKTLSTLIKESLEGARKKSKDYK